MSAFIYNESSNSFLSFREFILSEAVAPKECKYGTDLSNKQWIKFKDIVYTFLEKDNMFYTIRIDLDGGEIGFASSREFPENITSFKVIDSYFDHIRKGEVKNSASIFGSIIYVILEATKKYDIPIIFFYANDDGLSSLYDALITNKIFINRMFTNGYKFERKLGKFYTFERIS